MPRSPFLDLIVQIISVRVMDVEVQKSRDTENERELGSRWPIREPELAAGTRGT